jgi:protein PsiE
MDLTHSDFVIKARARFNLCLQVAELMGLGVVAIATTVAMTKEAFTMWETGHVTLTDLLLMFLYLEVLAMVGKHFKAGQLPVKLPLIMAMVAMARELILGSGSASEWHVIATAGAVLMLALGVLVLRFGQVKYPTEDDEKVMN